MNKPVFAMVLGGVLGVFDGLTALVSAPEVAPEIVGIVIGSTFKGLLTGVLIGFFARKVRSLPLGIAFGLAVGLFFAFLVAAMPSATGKHYYWQIMLPGGILGVIVGYAAQRHQGATRVVTAVALSLALAGAAQAAEPAAGTLTSRQAFDRLKSLAGEWQGTAMAKDGPPATVRYEVVSAGHAVMERLFPGTEHEMLSLYYLEGDQLVMTHYCAMGNQPRMRFEKGGPAELSFAFAGGTNFDPKKDTHIHSARYTWPDEGHLEAEWAVYQGEKQTGANRVFLSRKK